jgi:hypothetical protein
VLFSCSDILFADVSDNYTDVDLTSMYFNQSLQGQPNKKRRSDSCGFGEAEVEKENR